MRNVYLAAIGLSAMLAMGATAANAADDASLSSCTHAQTKVSSALSSDTSANHDAAVKESKYGREFCNSGFYQRGMDHYANAMKLLGVS
jgi:hypothetical protein